MSAEARRMASRCCVLRGLVGAALVAAAANALAADLQATDPQPTDPQPEPARYRWVYPSDDPLRVRPAPQVRGVALPTEDGLQTLPDCTSVRWPDSPGAGAPEPELTLPQAIHLALCQQPDLQAAQAAIGQAAAALGQARAAWWPTLSAGLSRTRQVQSVEGLAGMADRLDATSRSIGLTWRVFDAGVRQSRERAQQQLLQAAGHSIDATARKVMLDVVQQYFAAQHAQALIGAREANLRLVEQMWRSALRLTEQGLADASEALQARGALARAQYDLSVARGEADKARALLTQTLGMSDTARYRLPVIDPAVLMTGPVPLPRDLPQAPEPWLAVQRQQHPAVVAARAQVEAARANVQAAQREGLPSVDLSWNLYDNGRPNQSLSTRSSSERSVALTLHMPLFDGFAQTYKVMAAQQQLVQRQAELASARAQVQKEGRLAHADAVAAADNLAAARHLVTSAQEAADSMQRRHARGAAHLTQLNQALSALNQAHAELMRAWTDWQSTRLRLAIQSALDEGHAAPPAELLHEAQRLHPNSPPEEKRP